MMVYKIEIGTITLYRKAYLKWLLNYFPVSYLHVRKVGPKGLSLQGLLENKYMNLHSKIFVKKVFTKILQKIE